MRNFNEIFRKDVNYDNFDIHKRQCFIEDTFSKKQQLGLKLAFPAFFGLTNTANI